MIHKIQNDRLTVTANDFGAELFSVVSTDGTEYIWQGTAPYWDGRACNIFPVCGRLFGGSYTCNGKEYAMNCHGFARKTTFEHIASGSDRLAFRLTSNQQTKAEYPFDFELIISYTLEGNKLHCVNHVVNTGDDILPFATGAHPGFCVPLSKGLSFEDYFIDFGKVGSITRMVLSDTCFVVRGEYVDYPLRDGRYIDLKHSLFDNDAIFFKNVPTSVTLASDKDDHSVTLTCPQVDHFGLWHTTRSDAPFVCMEPWAGIPSYDGIKDDIATKEKMVRLSPRDSYDFSYDIIFN